jgi:hypothetical protein
MALTCPRCGTDVPNEALYCPYCSLPKPKRGFAAEEGKPEETVQGVRNPVVRTRKPAFATRKPSVATGKATPDAKKSPGRSLTRPQKPPRKLRVSVLSVAALIAVFSVGIYIFVVPLVYSEQAEPKTVLAALDKLRKTPSNEPDLTIEARLSRQLETSRRVKNLTAYQGWTVQPIKGTRTKVVLVFSYEEVGGVHHSAEWIADLANNTFTPQTELAEAVSIKEPSH